MTDRPIDKPTDMKVFRKVTLPIVKLVWSYSQNNQQNADSTSEIFANTYVTRFRAPKTWIIENIVEGLRRF